MRGVLEMVVIKRSNESDPWLTEKGTWRPAIKEDRRTATMSCPQCGQSASLSNHRVYENGVVSPSVVCAMKECSFHEHIMLEGWKGQSG